MTGAPSGGGDVWPGTPGRSSHPPSSRWAARRACCSSSEASVGIAEQFLYCPGPSMPRTSCGFHPPRGSRRTRSGRRRTSSLAPGDDLSKIVNILNSSEPRSSRLLFKGENVLSPEGLKQVAPTVCKSIPNKLLFQMLRIHQGMADFVALGKSWWDMCLR